MLSRLSNGGHHATQWQQVITALFRRPRLKSSQAELNNLVFHFQAYSLFMSEDKYQAIQFVESGALEKLCNSESKAVNLKIYIYIL